MNSPGGVIVSEELRERADTCFCLHAAAREAGERPALLLAQPLSEGEPGELLSFAALAEQALAHPALLPLQQEAGTRQRPVGLVAQTDRASLFFFFAALHARIPLLLLHPRTPIRRQQELLTRAGARYWSPDGQRLEPVCPSELSSAGEAPPLPPGAQILLETSGSTGSPKLVVHTRASLLAAAEASAKNLGWSEQGDRWHLSLPFSHVGGLSVLLRCFLARQTSVIFPLSGATPARVRELLAAFEVSLLSLVPTQLKRLLSEPSFSFPPQVRAALVGGAALAPALREEARRRGLPILCTYGMTEFGSQIATEKPGGTGSGVGFPLPGTELRLTEEGRIQVRAASACAGYLGQPSPFDEDGWFSTNDRGFWDERGHLHVAGRLDQLIITGGENVHPEMVEAALLELAEIGACCVVPVPDAEWGQKIVAVVCLTGASLETGPHIPVTQSAVWTQALRAWLPSYALPKDYLFLCEFPQLRSGKLDRVAVQSWAVQMLSSDRRLPSSRQSGAPT